jgi:GNAT superfamily N-acetyltransferase
MPNKGQITKMDYAVVKADPQEAHTVATLLLELLEEIMTHTGGRHFNVDRSAAVERCGQFLEKGIYTAFIAKESVASATAIGVITLTETHALYAEGAFGIIPELYVKPPWRSRGVGATLLDAATQFGRQQRWKRLEVTTPPIPEFDRTFQFYCGNGFSIAGGRKMKILL